MLRQFQQTFSYQGIGHLGDGPDGICPLPAEFPVHVLPPSHRQIRKTAVLGFRYAKKEFAPYLSRCFRSRTHYALWLRAFSVDISRQGKRGFDCSR
jgi:hypothetical protein